MRRFGMLGPSLFLLIDLLLVGACRADTGGFDSLRRLIASQGITSVEGLIAALPEDLRSHYSLVFASRSLQAASFANPRAVLFGSNAELIVSFNGNPQQRGYATVETMEFDPHTNRFNYREIAFPGSGIGAAVSISEPNPARCIACHDRPTRPIWDVAPVWPGVYGERYRAGLSAAETAGMREFLRKQPTHPRYRYLLGAAALADRETYVPSSRAMYAGQAVEPPNARLSALLATLNVRFILSQIAAAPAFDSHRFVLLATAGGTCGALSEFYPHGSEAVLGAGYEGFAQAAAGADHVQAQTKSGRRASGTRADRTTHGANDLTMLRFVVENDLRVPTGHWTLAFERGTYDLSAPDGTLTLEQALFEWVARTDLELRGLAAYRTFSPGDAYCEHLRRESRRALAAWDVSAAQSSTAPGAAAPLGVHARPALIDRCMSCHTGDIAPALPFADAAALAARLSVPGYPRGRLLDEILYRIGANAGVDGMPRGINISPAERRELEEYFLALAARR